MAGGGGMATALLLYTSPKHGRTWIGSTLNQMCTGHTHARAAPICTSSMCAFICTPCTCTSRCVCTCVQTCTINTSHTHMLHMHRCTSWHLLFSTFVFFFLKSIHLLVHPQNAFNSKAWTRQKPGSQNSIWISLAGSRDPRT